MDCWYFIVYVVVWHVLLPPRSGVDGWTVSGGISLYSANWRISVKWTRDRICCVHEGGGGRRGAQRIIPVSSPSSQHVLVVDCVYDNLTCRRPVGEWQSRPCVSRLRSIHIRLLSFFSCWWMGRIIHVYSTIDYLPNWSSLREYFWGACGIEGDGDPKMASMFI